MLLASLTLMLSSNATAQTTDTLVYVPEYLMEALMSDLDACDLERIELKKAKAELALLYVDLAKKDAALNTIKRDLASTREYNDTLVAQNMQLALDNTKQLKKVKRSRNLWFTTTLAATLGAFGVHQDWKNSWFGNLIGKKD
jgi:hypothetical protein